MIHTYVLNFKTDEGFGKHDFSVIREQYIYQQD